MRAYDRRDLIRDRQQVPPLRYCRRCAREIYPAPYGAPRSGRLCRKCERLYERQEVRQ